MSWRKQREAELLLGTRKGLAVPCTGGGGRGPLSGKHTRAAGEQGPWAGEGAGQCEPRGPALESLKSRVLANVSILGEIMRVGH